MRAKAFTLIALIFASLLAGLTSSVHFVILTVTHEPAFHLLPRLPLLASFTWPSIAYALDILAWDVFFALSVLFAQQAFSSAGVGAWIRTRRPKRFDPWPHAITNDWGSRLCRRIPHRIASFGASLLDNETNQAEDS